MSCMVSRLVGAVLIATACASALTQEAHAPTIEQAMDDYKHARYAKAEEGLRAAAKRGDVRAQELLGFMYSFGPKVYPGIPYDRHAAAMWFERAARGGSASARYMYCTLTRHANTYRPRSAPCFSERSENTGRAARD